MTWWNTLDVPRLDGLHVSNVLLGLSNIYNEGKLLNCCLLIAKWVIYRSKSINKQPNIYGFHCELKNFLRVEEQIAISNKTYDNFINDWDIMINIL
jgi:hypothetical protein